MQGCHKPSTCKKECSICKAPKNEVCLYFLPLLTLKLSLFQGAPWSSQGGNPRNSKWVWGRENSHVCTHTRPLDLLWFVKSPQNSGKLLRSNDSCIWRLRSQSQGGAVGRECDQDPQTPIPVPVTAEQTEPASSGFNSKPCPFLSRVVYLNHVGSPPSPPLTWTARHSTQAWVSRPR